MGGVTHVCRVMTGDMSLVCVRLVRLLWTGNQSFLKEINPEYSWERLKLKFQYFGHLMQRAYSLEKNMMLAKIEVRRRRG